MAEYKQYLSQEQETGSVMISEDVVSTMGGSGPNTLLPNTSRSILL